MPQDVKMEIANIIRQINSSTNADKIYLLGSYAYRNPNEDSDTDLCIVTTKVNQQDMKFAIEFAKNIEKLLEDILIEYD